MKIKVVFNQDIRRWGNQEDVSFEAVEAYVKQCWGNQLPENYSLSFRDEEGDQITITNDAEFQEALLIARDDCRTSLKVTVTDVDDSPDFIVLGSKDSSSSDDDMYDAQRSIQPEDIEAEPAAEQPEMKEAQPQVAPGLPEDQSMSVDGIHMDTALAVMAAGHSRAPTMEGEPEMKQPADATSEQPTGEQPESEAPCCDLKELAQQFFSDEAIVAQLPDCIDVIFEALRKGDPIQVALDLVFGTFPVIHEHKFVQSVIGFLPAFIPKLQSIAPFILLLGPEVVKQHVTQLLELVKRCLGSADGAEIDISPIMQQCCPNLINMMQAGLPNRPNGTKCARKECNLLAHSKQGHGFCCWRCKRQGQHGPRCEQNGYNGHEQTVGVEQLLSHFGMGMPDLEGRATTEMEAETQPTQNDGPVTHTGVTCDGCGVSPIVGARFKSAVIADYDLCADCEEKGVEGHPREYPMIKFGTTMQTLQGMRADDGIRFKGMGEFWWQSKKGQCGGRWGGWRRGGRGRGRGGRRHGGRGRGGCPFKRWCRPDWAADRANQQEEGHKHAQEEEQHKAASTGWGWGGHHGHGNHGWGWGGPYGGRGRGFHGPRGGHHGPHGCPPWIAKKLAWMEQMKEEGSLPPWMAKKMAWMKNMAGQSQTESSQPKPAKLKAAYLSDVTIPDRSVHASGLTLIKTWKMRNTGSASWEGCYLQFVKGDKSLIAGIEDTSLNGRFPVANAAPNSVVEVSATIQTPQKEGRYCAYFRLHGVDGTRFGPQIWVDIKVTDNASAERDIDMALRPCQVKRVQKTAKKVAKLDGLRRKLHKKLEKLERKQQKIHRRSEELQDCKPRKAAKLQMQARNLQNKMQHIGSRLEDVSSERDERAASIDQLYGASGNEPTAAVDTAEMKDASDEVATGVESMTIEEDGPTDLTADEVQAATADAEQPEDEPMVADSAFQYQQEFEKIMDFGFQVEANVVRYLLTENKGDVGAVVNNLLAAS